MGSKKSSKGGKVNSPDSAQGLPEAKEIALLKTQLVRALADYDNLNKRYERDSEQFGTIARSQMLMTLMPAFDMVESAQNHLADAGLAMAITTLDQSIHDLGFDKIISKPGEKFDEEVHEAVEVVSESDKENGVVVELVLNGWRITEGAVIRHAKVKVNRLHKQ